MQFGLALPNFGKHADTETITGFAKRAEELGFDSLWVSEHIVIPKSHNVFGDIFYEPLVTLGFVASLTRRIQLGTSIIVLPYRNPVVLAKTLATLDVLSGKRLTIGVGTGWLRDEFDAVGADFENRGDITDEYLEIIKELFSSEEPHFEGKYNHFSNISFLPKPHQSPSPPIWIGGNSNKAIERALKYGNGWHPVGLTPSQIRLKLNGMGNTTKKKLTISVRKNLQITQMNIDDPTELLRGSIEKIIIGLNDYKKAGVDHMVFQILSGNPEGIFRTMDRFSSEIRPKL